mgnify:CR=1 FL=1
MRKLKLQTEERKQVLLKRYPKPFNLATNTIASRITTNLKSQGLIPYKKLVELEEQYRDENYSPRYNLVAHKKLINKTYYKGHPLSKKELILSYINSKGWGDTIEPYFSQIVAALLCHNQIKRYKEDNKTLYGPSI